MWRAATRAVEEVREEVGEEKGRPRENREERQSESDRHDSAEKTHCTSCCTCLKKGKQQRRQRLQQQQQHSDFNESAKPNDVDAKIKCLADEIPETCKIVLCAHSLLMHTDSTVMVDNEVRYDLAGVMRTCVNMVVLTCDLTRQVIVPDEAS